MKGPSFWLWRASMAVGLCFCAGCASTGSGRVSPSGGPEIRFLLMFDDGPSIREKNNPTLSIVDRLESNAVQPGIKALFFVQTGDPRAGGSPRGEEVMRTVHDRGHVLGIHSVSPRGHISHISQPSGELAEQLREAIARLADLTGEIPRFVHPPFGAYNPRTQAIYQQKGLDLLLANVRARDGVIYVFNQSPRRRGHLRRDLKRLHAASAGHAPPTVAVVNFHDINPYTARKMEEYLLILVEEAAVAGFSVPEKPFIDCREQLVHIAEMKSRPNRIPIQICRSTGQTEEAP